MSYVKCFDSWQLSSTTVLAGNSLDKVGSGKKRHLEEPDCRILPATPLGLYKMSHAHHDSWLRNVGLGYSKFYGHLSHCLSLPF